MKEFNHQGLKEADIITKETWFLKDIVNQEMIFPTPGGPSPSSQFQFTQMNYMQTPGQSMMSLPNSMNSSFLGETVNIHAQIFYQL